MPTVPNQFERVAEVIADRTADLLAAPVSVVDDRGVVVASSDPTQLGRLTDGVAGESAGYLNVPLHLSSQSGAVLIGRPHDGEPISPRLATSLVELVIDQTAVIDRLPNKHELKNKLIHDLLLLSVENEAGVLREAQVLGMDFAPPRVVILIDAAASILAPESGKESPSDAVIQRRAQLVIDSVVDFFHLPNDTICAYIGEGEVAVLKASNKRSLTAWLGAREDTALSNPSWANLAALKRAAAALLIHLRSDTGSALTIGIGRHHPGIAGLARSYQDARAALSLGRQFQGENGVHCLDSLGVAAFVGVSDQRTKVDLATYLLAPLDHEPELMETIVTFFAQNCNHQQTARELCVHRNTLRYRLDKIASLIGLDPRRFDDAVQIRLALVLRALPGERITSEDRSTSQ